MSDRPSAPARRGVRAPARVAVLAFVLCLASAAFAAHVQAYVYWSNANGTIGRANLDGTNPNQAFVTGATGPRALAVDGSHIYWADYEGNAIGRANLDGTNVQTDFISATSPDGVAVDAGHVYWTNGNPGPDTIGRANLDGTGVDQSFITTADITFEVAVNDSHIYWANYSGGAIGRANLDGSGATQTLIPAGGDPQGVAVGPGRVYWANYDSTTSSIARANLDGSGSDPDFISGQSNPYGIAVDAGYVYWVNHDVDAVSRATLDGSTITPALVSGADNPWGVAVDALPLPPQSPGPDPPAADTDPPQTSITKSPANRSEKPKAKYRFEADEPGSSFECKLKGRGLKRSARKFGDCDSPHKYKRLGESKFRFQVRAIDPAGNVDPSPAKDKFKVVG